MGNSLLYAFQTTPGYDFSLRYGAELTAVLAEAQDSRMHLRLDEPNTPLAPTMVYEIAIRAVDIGSLVDVLNESRRLPEVVLGEHRLVRILDN